MRKSIFSVFALLSVFIWPLAALPGKALAEPAQVVLGGTGVRLSGPAGHFWVNSKKDAGLTLAPSRYSNLITHVLSMYARNSFNSLGKLYNNHGAIFYVGPKDKIWTGQDFALLKQHLMPLGEHPEQSLVTAGERFLQRFLRDGVGFDIPDRKARKYFARLQQAVVLRESDEAVVMALRHRKKGEKAKYVTMSLALIRGKLVGAAYYQVDPGKKERQRADALALDWQDAILAANS